MIPKGSVVLVIDDLLATGGTAAAACDLLDKCGAKIFEVNFLIELRKLNGISKKPQNVNYYSIWEF